MGPFIVLKDKKFTLQKKIIQEKMYYNIILRQI